MAGAVIEMQPVVEGDYISIEVEAEEQESVVIDDVILYYVFDFLTVSDLKKVRLVCKQWARIGALPLAKNTQVFMKTDQVYGTCGFQAFVNSAKDANREKFMKYRNFELYHVNPYDEAIPTMLTAPVVKDSITSLRIHGPQLRWLKSVLPLLPTLTELGYDDTHYVSKTKNPEQTVPAIEEPDTFVEETDEEAVVCSIETLEVHINGHTESNPLNWLLPISPKLKNVKLVIVYTNQLLHSVNVFRDCYAGPGLKSLRVSGSFGYSWSDTGEKIPDRNGARAIADLLAIPSVRNIRSLQIHAPCYPIEWRDNILNVDLVESLMSLTIDVYLRVGLQDFQTLGNGSIMLKPTERNPEPKDVLSAFPMKKNRIAMPNLLSLKIDVDYRASEPWRLDEPSHLVIGTSRIFPSLLELEIDVRMFKSLPVDITSCFSSAFPVLSTLVISMTSPSFIKGLLLSLPKTVKKLRMLASLPAAKCEGYPRSFESRENTYTLNVYRVTDQDFLDTGAIFLVSGLTELSVEFNCDRLTDLVVTDGFMKLPFLRRLALGGHPRFSDEILTTLNEKLDRFSVGWREEY